MPSTELPSSPIPSLRTVELTSAYEPVLQRFFEANPQYFLAVYGERAGPNEAPGFNMQPSVINGFSDLILKRYGPERGAHSRSAVGLAELPFNIPVEIEGEVELYA